MLFSIPSFTLKLSLLSMLLLSSTAYGQATAPADDETTTESAQQFELPEKFENFEQLVAFVEEIDAIETPTESREKRRAHQRKVARTIVAAAEMMPTKELSDEDAMQSVFFQLQGLRILKQLDEPKSAERLEKAIAEAQADERADVQAVGNKFMIETGFSQWAAWGEEERAALITKITEYIKSRPPEPSQIDMVMTVANTLANTNSEKFAAQLIKNSLQHFQQSDDPQIKQTLPMLEGINRRLQLPGNKIELSGKLLDGSELDWQSYRGKVVLVDFWATWCGPCRAEVPNILKMYEAYHDKGFEVLGISLDNTADDAESYIEQEDIPWPTLFSDKQSERGWRHPMAVRYGITGIPQAILVNREGKVVHMTARGPILERELRKLLGEPVAHSQRLQENRVQQVNFSFEQ